eukprot:c17449_g1_i1.p1 GENE.c17449_g1_i1~~c17449_g1_i1.p1  ORF type:complete len:833 (-),score=139.61 c17449_g1_i1:139-2637(-)
MGRLTNLDAISMTQSRLTGLIPSQLARLKRLTMLYLRENSLSGQIPSQLGSLPSLKRLVLSENMLAGSLPSQLGHLINLEFLFLQGNKLSGTLPTQLGTLTSLVSLILTDNKFSGGIPSQIGHLVRAIDFYVGSNQLTGTIPTEIGTMRRLADLFLFNNSLTGTIPTQIGRLRLLSDLYLSKNQLSGTIPSQLGHMPRLLFMSFRSNNLVGPIPSQFNQLSTLDLLDLSSNRLGGTFIPVGLPALNFLILHKNRLVGPIPSQIGLLSHLKVFTIFGNHLVGSVPPLFQDQNSMSLLFDNLLSCKLPQHTSENSTGNRSTSLTLVALGNSFPLDGWRLVEAKWLYSWDADSTHLFVGYPRPWVRLVAWLVLVLVVAGLSLCMHQRRRDLTYCRPPDLWLRCLKLCVGFSIFSVVFISLLASSPSIHTCPDPLSRITLAETNQLSSALCAGIIVCVVVHLLASVWCLTPLSWVRSRAAVSVRSEYAQMLPIENTLAPIPLARRVALVFSWVLAIMVLNIPTTVHFMAASFPTNNSLGISGGVVSLLRVFLSPLLVFIGEGIIPLLSNFFINQYYPPRSRPLVNKKAMSETEAGGTEVADDEANHRMKLFRNKKTELILASQLIVLVLAPVLSYVLVHEKCMRFARLMWRPCGESSTTFDFIVPARFEFQPNVTVLSQEDVCEVGFFTIADPGLCARGVIESTSTLNTFKVITQALLAMLRTLLELSATNSKTQQANCFQLALKKVMPQPADDDVTRSIVALVLLGLVYGGVAPLMWPSVLVGICATTLMWMLVGKRRGGQKQHVSHRILGVGVVMQLLLALWLFIASYPCAQVL